MIDSLSITEESSPWMRTMGIDRLTPKCRTQNLSRSNLTNEDLDDPEPKIIWLGHASFAIFWRNQTLLIDPVFARRIGPMPRKIPLSDSVTSITPNGILISHAHMDHLDHVIWNCTGMPATRPILSIRGCDTPFI